MRLLSLIGMFTLLLFTSCKDKNTTTSTQQKSSNNTLEVNGIIARAVSKTENIKTTGTTLSNEKVDLKSEITGRIVSIHFKEGSIVKKGQLLFKLDNSELVAEKKMLLLQIDLDATKERRQKQLLEARAISAEDYDITLGNLNILKANLDILQAKIDKTLISAPFTGLIGFRKVSEGAMITPTDILSTLQSIQPLKIEFTIPEKMSGNLKVGKDIQFFLAIDSKARKAKIYAIDPQIDLSSRSLMLRATYQNPNGDILPGAFADIEIAEAITGSFIEVPSMAYVPDINGALVYTLSNGRVKINKVMAASRNEKSVFIESGLNQGDTIITSGLLQIKPEMPIKVVIQDAKN
ncbi:MAG: efflux RND transporter periplasmic adaptor subunit [Saprospiraceae bacterium]